MFDPNTPGARSATSAAGLDADAPRTSAADAPLTPDSCLYEDQSGLPPDSPLRAQSTLTPGSVQRALQESFEAMLGAAPSAAPVSPVSIPQSSLGERVSPAPGPLEGPVSPAPRGVGAVLTLPTPAYYAIWQGVAVTPRDRSISDITALVMHTPEGGESGTLSVLRGPRASFDWFLPLSSHLYRCNNPLKFIAWQAGDWPFNERSVGIEQGTFAAQSQNFGDIHYNNLADLVAYVLSVFTAIPFRHITNPTDKGLISHHDITPWRRTDPGAGFRWDYLMRQVDVRLHPPSTGIVWERGHLIAAQGAVARKDHTVQAAVLHTLTPHRTYDTDGYIDSEVPPHAVSPRWYHLTASSGYGWVHASGGAYTR